jgi:hypothetical protein
MIASALLLRGSAEGVSSYRIFGDEAYPQQYVGDLLSNAINWEQGNTKTGYLLMPFVLWSIISSRI